VSTILVPVDNAAGCYFRWNSAPAAKNLVALAMAHKVCRATRLLLDKRDAGKAPKRCALRLWKNTSAAFCKCCKKKICTGNQALKFRTACSLEKPVREANAKLRQLALARPHQMASDV
jgi:hypothetical protein